MAYGYAVKRRIPYLFSALLISGVLAVALRNFDVSNIQSALPPALREVVSAVPATSPSLRLAEPLPTETISPQAPAFTTTQVSDHSKATPFREVRVRAVRDGRDYGWVQLPRGTRVELLRDEGKTLLIRYDQVTLRVSRATVKAGLVVPVSRDAARLAGL